MTRVYRGPVGVRLVSVRGVRGVVPSARVPTAQRPVPRFTDLVLSSLLERFQVRFEL